jgi:hypothetical protein
MVGKDIYTNFGTVGQTEWPDGEACDTQWESRTDGHSDGCPTEGGRAPGVGGQVPDGGRTGARRRPGVADGGLNVCLTEGGVSGGGPTAGLGGGPTGDYIRDGGPSFWALSSCA